MPRRRSAGVDHHDDPRPVDPDSRPGRDAGARRRAAAGDDRSERSNVQLGERIRAAARAVLKRSDPAAGALTARRSRRCLCSPFAAIYGATSHDTALGRLAPGPQSHRDGHRDLHRDDPRRRRGDVPADRSARPRPAELARAKDNMDRRWPSMADGFLPCDAEDRVVAWNNRYLEMFPAVADRDRRRRRFRQPGRGRRGRPSPLTRSSRPPGASSAGRPSPAATRRSSWNCRTAAVIHVIERRTPDGGMVSVMRDITLAERELTAPRPPPKPRTAPSRTSWRR